MTISGLAVASTVLLTTGVLWIVAGARRPRTTATRRRARRLLVAGGFAGAVLAAAVTAQLADPARLPEPQPVAQRCEIVAPNGIVIPACGPGLSGGSVSAGAPSQGLITLKNWCNLIIGGCSAAFYYPPGPVLLPEVDTSVRNHPSTSDRRATQGSDERRSNQERNEN